MTRSHPILWFFASVGGFGFILILLIFATALFAGRVAEVSPKGNVALIEVTGVINQSQPIINSLIKHRKNSQVKAILLRIDSPGGAIVPAQEIYSEVKNTVKTKPVVVSMGSVAASGGYYIAAPASRILANPGTVTGSIGVIMNHMIYEDLARKLLLRWEVIKAGDVKDMGSPLRSLKPEERKIFEGMVSEFHEQFIRDISLARKLPIETVRPLATGTIFSGESAVKNKLVDEIGGIQEALQVAGKLANIKGEPELMKETPSKRLRDRIIDRLVEGTFQGLGQILTGTAPTTPLPQTLMPGVQP